MVTGTKKYDHIRPILKDLQCKKGKGKDIKILFFVLLPNACEDVLLYVRELLVKQAKGTRTPISISKHVLQIPHTNLKRFGCNNNNN